jgi:hypothetical protein
MDKDKFYGFSTGELIELRDMWIYLIREGLWQSEDRDLYNKLTDKIYELCVCITNRKDRDVVSDKDKDRDPVADALADFRKFLDEEDMEVKDE